MAELPGKKCPYCERPTSLGRGGRIQRHKGLGGAKCRVAGKTLEEARNIALDAALAFAAELSSEQPSGERGA